MEGKQCVAHGERSLLSSIALLNNNKSSVVAEMGDRGHNRHGPTSVPSGVFIHPAVWPQ